MPHTKKTIKVKAWFVDLEISHKYHIKFFSGDGYFRAYITKKRAKYEWDGHNVKIFPCTITYQLPSNKKKKHENQNKNLHPRHIRILR